MAGAARGWMPAAFEQGMRRPGSIASQSAMRPILRWSLLATAILGWFIGRTDSHAATVALKPVADTTLFEANPDNNLGGNETAAIGATAEG